MRKKGEGPLFEEREVKILGRSKTVSGRDPYDRYAVHLLVDGQYQQASFLPATYGGRRDHLPGPPLMAVWEGGEEVYYGRAANPDLFDEVARAEWLPGHLESETAVAAQGRFYLEYDGTSSGVWTLCCPHGWPMSSFEEALNSHITRGSRGPALLGKMLERQWGLRGFCPLGCGGEPVRAKAVFGGRLGIYPTIHDAESTAVEGVIR